MQLHGWRCTFLKRERAHSGSCRWIRSALLDKLSFRSHPQELSAVRWPSEGAAQSNDGWDEDRNLEVSMCRWYVKPRKWGDPLGRMKMDKRKNWGSEIRLSAELTTVNCHWRELALSPQRMRDRFTFNSNDGMSMWGKGGRLSLFQANPSCWHLLSLPMAKFICRSTAHWDVRSLVKWE